MLINLQTFPGFELTGNRSRTVSSSFIVYEQFLNYNPQARLRACYRSSRVFNSGNWQVSEQTEIILIFHFKISCTGFLLTGDGRDVVPCAGNSSFKTVYGGRCVVSLDMNICISGYLDIKMIINLSPNPASPQYLAVRRVRRVSPGVPRRNFTSGTTTGLTGTSALSVTGPSLTNVKYKETWVLGFTKIPIGNCLDSSKKGWEVFRVQTSSEILSSLKFLGPHATFGLVQTFAEEY